jgi:hypothetical protein
MRGIWPRCAMSLACRGRPFSRLVSDAFLSSVCVEYTVKKFRKLLAAYAGMRIVGKLSYCCRQPLSHASSLDSTAIKTHVFLPILSLATAHKTYGKHGWQELFRGKWESVYTEWGREIRRIQAYATDSLHNRSTTSNAPPSSQIMSRWRSPRGYPEAVK